MVYAQILCLTVGYDATFISTFGSPSFSKHYQHQTGLNLMTEVIRFLTEISMKLIIP